MKDCFVSLAPSGRFVVKAPYWHVNACRAIPSRRFMSVRKEWVAPVTRINSRYLLDVFGGATWDPGALKAANDSVGAAPLVSEPFPPWYSFKVPPFDHQRDALNKAWSRPYFGLFMEMGTGKTKAMIDLLCAKAMDGQLNAALILAPLSVVLSWRDEILQYSTVDSTIVRLLSTGKHKNWPASNGVELASGFTWYLANIEGLSAGRLSTVAMQSMAGLSFAVVVDESARIKNHETARTKNCMKIGALAKMRYIMSGLPVLKGALDLFSQMQFLDPAITGVGDYYCFRNRYAVMGGWENRELLGYQNLDELTTNIAPYVYQITKAEALSLPDKVYKEVRVELRPEQLAAIRHVKSGLVGNKLKSRTLKNVLEKVLRIQQISSGAVLNIDSEDRVVTIPMSDNPKIQALSDILEDSDQPVIVWCTFKFEVAAVKALFDSLGLNYVVHDGDTKEAERKQAINDFQGGGVRGFIATVQSGGIGITLTAASQVVYMSNSWSLDARAQSEDRAHRIGQKNKVQYIDILADGSVDELVKEALKNKRDLADHIRELINKGAPIGGLD